MLIKTHLIKFDFRNFLTATLFFIFCTTVSHVLQANEVNEKNDYIIQEKPYTILEGYCPGAPEFHREKGFFSSYLPPIHKANPSFTESGIEEIALFILAKDEDDIIYENLVWHYCLGFRKFVIMNNNSSDNTRKLIKQFRNETQASAQLILIDDPINEFIQSDKTKAGYLVVKNLWPKVKWLFLADADEFWCPENNLKAILNQVPEQVDSILASWINYLPGKDYFSFKKDDEFYKKLHYTSYKSSNHTKTVIKVGANDLSLHFGNHCVYSYGDKAPKSMLGSELNLFVLHFSIRSPKQVEKKSWNFARASIAEQGEDCVAYKVYKDFKNTGFDNWFKSYIEGVSAGNNLDDTIPMDQAFDLYKKLINKKTPNKADKEEKVEGSRN